MMKKETKMTTKTLQEVRTEVRAHGFRVEKAFDGSLFAYDPRNPHLACRAVDGVVSWKRVAFNQYVVVAYG